MISKYYSDNNSRLLRPHAFFHLKHCIMYHLTLLLKLTPWLFGQLQVTGLSWNCTGAVVAAAFGRFDHEDWCTHRSTLCTWNLDRRGLVEDKPDIVIDVPSCLMCIACHPKKPAWIVGGTFNGEITR